jgi:hypothetical protein
VTVLSLSKVVLTSMHWAALAPLQSGTLVTAGHWAGCTGLDPVTEQETE